MGVCVCVCVEELCNVSIHDPITHFIVIDLFDEDIRRGTSEKKRSSRTVRKKILEIDRKQLLSKIEGK